MDEKTKSPYRLTYNPTTPAYLVIGSHEYALEQIIVLLQSIFCANNGCGVCAPCRQIQLQQHHSITWFYPEKNYTLEQFEPLTHQISFALDENQKHFFIIQKAEALTPSCSNALLKSLEEPPHGYHYILMTRNPDSLLATIRSRCVEYTLQSPESILDHPLAPYFTGQEQNPVAFLQILEKKTPTEQESAELVDALLTYWCAEYKKEVIAQKKLKKNRAHKRVTLFTQATQQLPMAGSSKLFWKNLYLQQ